MNPGARATAETFFDVGINRVIAADCHATAAAGGDFVGGVFDRAGEVVDGWSAARYTTGDVDSRAGFTQDGSNRSASAATGAGDESNFA
jgi:hypothetical protein